MSEIFFKLKEGDYKAFLKIYNLFHKRVYHFFLKRIFSSHAAEDLTQAVFIKLWEYRDRLSAEHTLEKQLFTICYSILINHLKKEATTRKHEKHYLELIEGGDSDTSYYFDYESRDEVNQAIKSLTPIGKQVISMKVIHGYSNKEIANDLSLSPKTVEGHVTKSFKSLRKVIKNSGVHLLSLLF